MTTVRHFIDGDWVGGRDPREQPLVATERQIAIAIGSAEHGAKAMRALSTEARAEMLLAIAGRLEEGRDELARVISLEMGKPIAEARIEAGRAPGIFRLAAAELAREAGEVLPLDLLPAGSGRFGFTRRQPCGIVLAITPFNYPLLLVTHKVAPALAAGNAVILKPASLTAGTAVLLAEAVVPAVPAGGFQLLIGPGEIVGPPLISDPRIRKISFTGSTAAGNSLGRLAGAKRLSLELGGNAPVIVCADADLEAAANSVGIGGFLNAGQACVSPQRVIVEGSIAQPFRERLVEVVEAIRVGPAHDEGTQLAGLITEAAATRVEATIREAQEQGAVVITGGSRDGKVLQPTVVEGIRPGMTLFDEELFGPAVGLMNAIDVDDAIRLANDTRYGLSAAIFTSSMQSAFRFARDVDAGNLMVNWNPLWRSDLMPYGGLKASGFGKEGPRYAIEEMTDAKTVVIHGLN
jgi:glyceraldehyde-3-phosphate dehydrogenase (NADP+)